MPRSLLPSNFPINEDKEFYIELLDYIVAFFHQTEID